MITNNWLIVVTAGQWQKHSIKQARRAGLNVFAVDEDPNSPGFIEAKEYMCVDILDTDAIVSKLKALEISPAGVTTFTSEAGMVAAAKLRDKFDLEGIRANEVELFTDKGKQRAQWNVFGVPGPKWKVVKNSSDLRDIDVLFDGPLIVKPTDASGSRGVTKVQVYDGELHAAVALAINESKRGEVIIEEFMDGVEYTAEAFAQNGEIEILAITEKRKVEGTSGTIAVELASPNICGEIMDELVRTAHSAFYALGLRNGPGHAELIRCTDGFIGMVEAAARGAGFLTFDKLVPAISGLNISLMTALNATGKKVFFDSGSKGKERKQAAVLRFFPSRPGLVKKVRGFSSANTIKGAEAGSFVKEGDITAEVRSDGDRLGYILATADDPRLAQKIADKAEAKIWFDIDGLAHDC